MSKEYPTDEARLVTLLSDGNEDAFGILFDRYRPRVYRLALKFLKSTALAEEVVQDVFLKVWLKRSEFAVLRRFDSYLFVIAKNATLDAFRKLSVKLRAEEEYATTRELVDSAIDYSLMDEHYHEMVKQSIALLPGQQARVFHMAKVEGLSHEAVARKMNISPLTVKKHMANALQFLRRRLENHLVTILLFTCVVSA